MAMIEGPGSDILKNFFREETGKVNEGCSVPGVCEREMTLRWSCLFLFVIVAPAAALLPAGIVGDQVTELRVLAP